MELTDWENRYYFYFPIEFENGQVLKISIGDNLVLGFIIPIEECTYVKNECKWKS